MKYQEIKNKSLHELENMLKEMQISLGKDRFELANNTLKDTSRMKKTRNDIAKIMTAIKELNKTSK